MDTLLKIKNLNAYYDAAQVLFDISLSVSKGEVIGLLGPNGAGKSSLIKSIMQFGIRTEGELIWQGRSINRRPSSKIARLGIGYVPEDRRLFGPLTVLDNLKAGMRPPQSDAPAWDLHKVYELFPKLQELQSRMARHLSGGEQQMVSIARSLLGNPVLLLLDEPCEGLAPIVIESLQSALMQMKQSGLTLIVAEQNPKFIEQIATRHVQLHRGVAAA